MTSLAKELGSTTLPDSGYSSISGEVPVRGTVDQQPIILEADVPVQSSAANASEPTSAVNDNPERRFVYIPTHDEDTSDDDHEVPSERANWAGNAPRRKEHPQLNTIPKFRPTPDSYTERKPSPYAIKGDRISGEYVMSPDMITPTKEYPTAGRRRHDSFSSNGRYKETSESRDSESQQGKSRPRRVSFRKDKTPRTSLESSRSDHTEDTKSRPRRRSFRRDETPRTSQEPSRSDYSEDTKLQEQLLRQAFLRNPPTENFQNDRDHPNVASRSRPSSRHVSPTDSPLSSPPRSPELERTDYHDSSPPNGTTRSRRTSRTGPRPASPLSTRHSYSPRLSRHETFDYNNHKACKHSDGSGSRRTSPLPLPTGQRLETQPGPRIDIQSPSPQPPRSGISQHQPDLGIRRPSPSPQSPRRANNPPYPDGPLHRPSLVPQLPPRSPSASNITAGSRRLAGEKQTPRSASFAVHDRRPEPPRSSEPTARSPSDPYDESQRRQDAHTLHAPPPLPSRPTEIPQPQAPSSLHTSTAPQKISSELPPCPRSRHVKGYNDWSTFSGLPNFDICPSCLQAAMAFSQYRHYFVRSPPRDPATPIKCDFSSPWVRHAWALTVKQRRPSLDLVYGVARVETTEVPCPGNAGAVAPWSHLIDPSTDRPVPNFDICPYCVRNAEASMPLLRGAFVRAYLPDPMMPRICDLRSDSARFPRYIALLEAATTKAETERRAPDLRAFADYARTRASLRECSRDDMVLSQGWHIMPHMPAFTVCEECYHDVVWPAVIKGSNLAGRFNRTLQQVGAPNQGVSCQLYSPRMRWTLGEAVERNDLEGLRRVVMERVGMEAMLQERHRDLQGMLAVHESLHGSRREGEREKEKIIDEIAHIAEEWKKWE